MVANNVTHNATYGTSFTGTELARFATGCTSELKEQPKSVDMSSNMQLICFSPDIWWLPVNVGFVAHEAGKHAIILDAGTSTSADGIIYCEW